MARRQGVHAFFLLLVVAVSSRRTFDPRLASLKPTTPDDLIKEVTDVRKSVVAPHGRAPRSEIGRLAKGQIIQTQALNAFKSPATGFRETTLRAFSALEETFRKHRRSEPTSGVIATGVSFLAGEVLSSVANYVLAVLLAIVVWIWLSSWLFGAGSEREMEKLDEVFDAEGELWRNSQQSFEDDVQEIKSIMESNFRIAENNFERKQRDFVKWLMRVGYNLKGSSDPRLIEPFKRFVTQWLVTFEECSLNPVEKPHRLVSSKDLLKCATIRDTVDLVLPKLKGDKLDLIGGEFKQVQTMATSLSHQASEKVPTRDIAYVLQLGCGLGCGLHFHSQSEKGGVFPFDLACCCARVKMISCLHVVLVLSPFLGLGFLVLQIYVSSVFGACAALGSSLFFLVVLCTQQEDQSLEMLEADVKRLQEKNRAAQDMANFVKDLQSRLGMLENLWLYRTIAHLDLLKAVHDGLEDQDDDDVSDFLARTDTQLGLITQAMGPISIWFGPNSIEEAKLQSIGQQLYGTSHVVYSRGDVARTIEGPKSERTHVLKEDAFVGKVEGWPEKESVELCGACQLPFGLLRKRFRCKQCGKIFCDNCANGRIPLPGKGFKEPQRVCHSCHGWVKDQDVKDCTNCHSPFTLFLRRHHCRRCGEAFCGFCASKSALVPKKGYTTDPVRVCDPCIGQLDQESTQQEMENRGFRRMPTIVREVRPMNFLTVRIVSASDLSNLAAGPLEKAGFYEQGEGPFARFTGGANMTDPYVRLSINDRQRFHTLTQDDTLEPEWDEEFFFPVNESDKLLMMEVCDDKGHMPHGSLGTVEVKFRDARMESGVLYTIQSKIVGGKGGDRGVLTFQIHFATDAWELETWKNPVQRTVVGNCNKSATDCEWMFADVGIAGMGVLNPMRWSGSMPLAEAVSKLTAEQSRNANRPVLLKVPYGIKRPKRFDNAFDAIAHLKSFSAPCQVRHHDEAYKP